MQEEFEKKIKERVHTFGMQPSHHVWDDLDAVLSSRKRRRVFVGWWVLLGLVVVAGGVLLYEKDNIFNAHRNPQTAVTHDTTNNNVAETIPAAPPVTENSIQQENANTQNNDATATKKTHVQNNIKAIQKSQPAISSATITDNNPAIQATGKTNITELNTKKKQPAENPTAYTPSTYKEPPPFLPGSDKQQQPVKEQPGATEKSGEEKHTENTDMAEKKITDAVVTPPAKNEKKVTVKTIAHSRGQWLFTFSGGTTQTVAQGLFNQDQEKSYAAAFPMPNLVAFTSPATFKYNIAAPSTGFNITAGAAYKYELGKRWRLNAGLQAAYRSNTQKTGLLYGNTISLDNGGLYLNTNSDQTQTSYYQAGPEAVNKLVNKAWLLQVPVGVSYVLNPRGKTKLLLNGGLSVAWMLSSHWLIPDGRYGKLYYNTSVLNNTIYSWQAGPSLELYNHLQLGLRYEQSFTTFAKSYVTPKLYWQNINIYTTIPFKAKAKKVKK